MIAPTLPRAEPVDEILFALGKASVQLDSIAFLADPELIRALTEHATPFVCDTDRILFHQDDPAGGLFILQEGEVTLSMTSPSGPAHPLGRGEARFAARTSRAHQQPALLAHGAGRAGARVSFLGRTEFTALMQSNPELSLKILQVLAAEVRSARNALY